MQDNVAGDQLVLIQVQGMHCHRCEQTLQRALMRTEGVHEVEVDYRSAQVSVLQHPNAASVRELVDAITQAGYRVTGYSQREMPMAG